MANSFVKAMTGTGEELIQAAHGLQNQYTTNKITINGLSTGTATIRVISKGGDELESVGGGTLTLTTNKTLIIEATNLDQIGITVSAGTAYTASIEQYNASFNY